MHDFYVTTESFLVTHTFQITGYIHEAGLIRAADNVRAAVYNVLCFFGHNLFRNFRLLDRKCSTKTATAVSVFHFNILQFFYLFQKFERLFLYSKKTC